MAVSSTRDQVFLSYAHEDLPQVQRLYLELKKRDVNLWFDKEHLGPGEWRHQIEKALASSKAFIFCLSSAALKKIGEAPGFAEHELNDAYKFAKSSDSFKIIPLRLEDCDRGDNRLSIYQQFDLFPDWNDTLDKLAVRLGGRSLSNNPTGEKLSDTDKDVEELVGKAFLFHYAGDYEKAYSTFTDIEQIKGRLTWIVLNKGIELFNLRRYQEALNCFSEVLQVEEDYVNALFSGAKSLELLNRRNEALANYEKILRIQPEHVNARYSLGRGAVAVSEAQPREASPDQDDYHIIIAEFIGEFFRSSDHLFYTGDGGNWHDVVYKPDAKPLVQIGDHVAEEQVLGVIFAMGYVYEIKSDVHGIVREILIEDHKDVEYGQPLFAIEVTSPPKL